MANAWIEDLWIKESFDEELPNGTIRTVMITSAMKNSLARSRDPFKANVPDEFRKAKYGKGRRWLVRWFETTNDGKRRAKTKSFANKADAEREAAALNDDLLSGRYINSENQSRTFAQAAQEWSMSQHDVRDSSVKQYNDLLRTYVIPQWGNVRLQQIDETAINQWISDLKEGNAAYAFRKTRQKPKRGLTNKYVNQIVNVTFGGVMRYALRRGWILRNPLDGIRIARTDPERENAQKVFLTEEEVEELAGAAFMLPLLGKYKTDRRDAVSAAIIRFSAYTGARPGETFALRVGDIDLDLKRVTISKTMTQDRNGNWKKNEGPTKTGKIRKVPLPDFLIEELRPLMQGRNPEEYLFRASRGEGRMDPRNWRNRVFNKAKEAAGLGDVEGLRPYSLRHTYASLAIKEGCDVKNLSEAMGHSDVSMTLNKYVGLWPDRLDEVARNLNTAREKACGHRH